MGRSDRVSRIWEEEIRSPTRWSRILENEIRRRPPEQSVRSAADRVRSAAAGGSVPAGPWTALIYILLWVGAPWWANILCQWAPPFSWYEWLFQSGLLLLRVKFCVNEMTHFQRWKQPPNNLSLTRGSCSMGGNPQGTIQDPWL